MSRGLQVALRTIATGNVVGKCLCICSVLQFLGDVLGGLVAILCSRQCCTVNVLAPFDIAQGAAVETALEHLISLIGVAGLSVVDSEGVALSRSGAGGAGETGDGHCRGGCHGNKALEYLIHCFSFSFTLCGYLP